MSEAVKAKVLLVDDDPALLDALSDALELRMPEVATQTCSTGRAALNAVREIDFEAVISDIKMPGMDGIELLSQVRQSRPETPVILITGHGQTDLAIQALRAGAFDLIQKPLDRDYFTAALVRALEVKRLKREVAAQQRALQSYTDSLELRVNERTAAMQEA